MIYALRDVTATIESIPLITASIMSKKLAEGAKGIVMDIKTGNGAFMAKLSDAKKLAESIRQTGLRFNKNMMTFITDMSEPLGLAVGNSLEIIECIETLKNNGPDDLTEISLSLAGGMVYLAGLAKTHQEGITKAKEALHSGRALEKFRELIANQGGDVRIVDDYSLLPHTKTTHPVLAAKSGYITKINCKAMGLHCVHLGGGRQKTSDVIDFAVGFVMTKKLGDKVKKGDVLALIHCHGNQMDLALDIAKSMNKSDITIESTKPRNKKKLIIEVQTKFAPIKKSTLKKITKR